MTTSAAPPSPPDGPAKADGPGRPSSRLVRGRPAVGRTRIGGWWVTLLSAAVAGVLIVAAPEAGAGRTAPRPVAGVGGDPSVPILP